MTTSTIRLSPIIFYILCRHLYQYMVLYSDHLCVQLNTGQVGGVPGRDLNVEPAWIQGITGKGVVVAVVDDG